MCIRDSPTPDASFAVPEQVLQRRVTAGARPVLQGLIKWSGMPASLATWENLEALRQRFPMASTWGQVDSQGGEDVSRPADAQEPSPRRRKPNWRVTGPEWVK